MNLVSFNCHNLKKNHLMVQKLINDFDSIFLIEHWLTNDEKYLISDLINDHSMIFESDMHDFSNKRKPGRPFGGRCWLIKNSVKVLAVEQFNKIVSMIKIRVSVNNVNKNMYIFGVWVPFDNGCQERLAAFQTTLALLESYKRPEVDPNDDLMAIMGDFNCDMDRNNRFDAIFKSFVFNNNFFNSLNYFDQEISYSYKNGDYKSSIDHILCNHALFQRVTNGQIMGENCKNSDHNPVHLSVELNLPINETLINSNSRTNKKFHFFDWNNETFREIYCSTLEIC